MRFYLKLTAMIGAFVVAAQLTPGQYLIELAFDVRVAFITRFGTADDFEALLDDTQRRLAAQRGELRAYELGKRFEALFGERLALAAWTEGPLSEDDVERIRQECAREVFAPANPVATRETVAKLDLQRPCMP